jgi:3-dehydroquinate dehydratase II
MRRILVMHGPNLNLLGEREQEIYGRQTLSELDRRLGEEASRLGLVCESFQSNHEGALIDRLHSARGEVSGILLNPGGLSHTSVSLRDAVALMPVPVILVHLSNLYTRESFRRRDLIAPVCAGVVMGLGGAGYVAALHALKDLMPDAEGVPHAGG